MTFRPDGVGVLPLEGSRPFRCFSKPQPEFPPRLLPFLPPFAGQTPGISAQGSEIPTLRRISGIQSFDRRPHPP